MGLFDKVKKLADDHADQVESAIEKVAKAVDHKTGGKYTDQIGKGVDAAKGFVGDDPGQDGDAPVAPPATPNP